MWIAEIAERAVLQAMAALDVTFRASRVDDDTAVDVERKKYPALVIQAASGNKETTESLFQEVPVTLTLITHFDDDPKRTTLASLEDQMRKITDKPIATSTLKTAFDDIASAAGETKYYKGLTAIEGGQIEVTNKEQTIITTMTMRVCGS